MTAGPGFETFVVGLLCGAVFGAAGTFAPRFIGLLLGLGAAVIVFIVADQGVQGLEVAVGGVIDEAVRNQHLVVGVVVGAVLAAALLTRRGNQNERREP